MESVNSDTQGPQSEEKKPSTEIRQGPGVQVTTQGDDEHKGPYWEPEDGFRTVEDEGSG